MDDAASQQPAEPLTPVPRQSGGLSCSPPSPYTPPQPTAPPQLTQQASPALQLTPPSANSSINAQGLQQQPSLHIGQWGWVIAPVVLLVALALEPGMRFATRLALLAVRYAFGIGCKLGMYGLLIALILGVLFLSFKLSVGLWRVMTFKADDLLLDHDCITPDGYDHRPVVQAVTRDLMEQFYPSIADIADDGSLVAFIPASLDSEKRTAAEDPPGSPATVAYGAAQASLATAQHQQQQPQQQAEAEPPWKRNEDVARCVAAEPPECIMLLGTSHVSKKSAEDAERVVMAVQPALVLLELDEGREAVLYRDIIEASSEGGNAKPSFITTLQMAMAGSKDEGFLKVLLQLMYAQVEEQLGTKAGLEFVAVRKAVEALGAGYKDGSMPDASPEMHLILGDRPVKETMQAIWAGFSPRKRLSFAWQLLRTLFTLELDEETMEKMKNDDALTAMCAEMAEDYPEVMRPLLHDRNWYLAVRMWQWAQRSPEGRPLVAVIGKGHVKGVVYALSFLTRATASYKAWLMQQDAASLEQWQQRLADSESQQDQEEQQQEQEDRGMFTVDSMGTLPVFDDS